MVKTTNPATAFPLDGERSFTFPSMTLRDWFAGQICANLSTAAMASKALPEDCAQKSYRLADAMLEFRAKADPSAESEQEPFSGAGVDPACENTSVPIGGNVSEAVEAPHSASEGVSGGQGGDLPRKGYKRPPARSLAWEEPSERNNHVHMACSPWGTFGIHICGGRHQAWLEAHEKPYERWLGDGYVGSLFEAKEIAEAHYQGLVASLFDEVL